MSKLTKKKRRGRWIKSKRARKALAALLRCMRRDWELLGDPYYYPPLMRRDPVFGSYAHHVEPRQIRQPIPRERALIKIT